MLGRLINRSGDVPATVASLAIVRIVFGAVGVLSVVRIVGYGWVEELYAGPSRRFSYPGLGWVAPPGVAGTYVLLGGRRPRGTGGDGRLDVPAGHRRVRRRIRVDRVRRRDDVSQPLLVHDDARVGHDRRADGRPVRSPRPSDDGRSVAVGCGWCGSTWPSCTCSPGSPSSTATGCCTRCRCGSGSPRGRTCRSSGQFLEQRWTAYALSWAGAAFDCSVVALLLWRRTRVWAWVAVVAFHVATWVLFPIGVFPWLMIGVTTIFFAPDWPERDRDEGAAVATVDRIPSATGAPIPAPPDPLATWHLVVAALWVLVIVAIPLRHHVIPGDARWTNEGYRFSWNVLLTEKGADVRFRVTEPATRHRLGRDRERSVHAHAVAGDGERPRADPAGGPRHRRRVPRRRPPRRGARRCVRVVQRPTGASPRSTPTVDLSREPYRLFGQPWILPAPDGDPP